MNIKISKHAHSCAACGNDFRHEQVLTSIVRVLEGVLHRQDYCQECWQAEENKEAFSVWSMVYLDTKLENQAPPEVYSPLRQLFYEAAEGASRVDMAKAFLAAGLLRRQKVFRLIKESDESDGDVRITLYTDRIGNRLIEVPDPQFTFAELDQARIQLVERLQQLEAATTAEKAGTEAPQGKPAAEASTTPEPGPAPEAGEDGEAPEPSDDEPVEEDEPVDDSDEGDDDEDEDEDEYDDDDEDDDDDDDDDEYDDDDDDDDDDDEDDEDEYDDDDDDDDDDEEEEDIEYEDDDEEDGDGDESDDEEENVMQSARYRGDNTTRMMAVGAQSDHEEAYHAQA